MRLEACEIKLRFIHLGSFSALADKLNTIGLRD